jgi:hypothetical protein
VGDLTTHCEMGSQGEVEMLILEPLMVASGLNVSRECYFVGATEQHQRHRYAKAQAVYSSRCSRLVVGWANQHSWRYIAAYFVG